MSKLWSRTQSATPQVLRRGLGRLLLAAILILWGFTLTGWVAFDNADKVIGTAAIADGVLILMNR